MGYLAKISSIAGKGYGVFTEEFKGISKEVESFHQNLLRRKEKALGRFNKHAASFARSQEYSNIYELAIGGFTKQIGESSREMKVTVERMTAISTSFFKEMPEILSVIEKIHKVDPSQQRVDRSMKELAFLMNDFESKYFKNIQRFVLLTKEKNENTSTTQSINNTQQQQSRQSTKNHRSKGSNEKSKVKQEKEEIQVKLDNKQPVQKESSVDSENKVTQKVQFSTAAVLEPKTQTSSHIANAHYKGSFSERQVLQDNGQTIRDRSDFLNIFDSRRQVDKANLKLPGRASESEYPHLLQSPNFNPVLTCSAVNARSLFPSQHLLYHPAETYFDDQTVVSRTTIAHYKRGDDESVISNIFNNNHRMIHLDNLSNLSIITRENDPVLNGSAVSVCGEEWKYKEDEFQGGFEKDWEIEKKMFELFD